MKICDILKILNEGKVIKEDKQIVPSITKAETNAELNGKNQIEKINSIIEKLQNLAQISQKMGYLSEDEMSDVSLNTIYYLVSTQNKVINNTLASLKLAGINPPTYNSNGKIDTKKSRNNDVYEIIKDAITLKGWDNNILEELAQFFANRDELGLTFDDMPINNVFNIKDLLTNKTGVNAQIISSISNIKGSAGITRGAYEVALSIFSKNGSLDTIGGKKKNEIEEGGDIIIDGKKVEIKSSKPEESSGGKLCGQKTNGDVSRDVSTVIRGGNEAIKEFYNTIKSVLKSNIAAPVKQPGFAIFKVKNNISKIARQLTEAKSESDDTKENYLVFDTILVDILIDAINSNEEITKTTLKQNEQVILKAFNDAYVKLFRSLINTDEINKIINSLTGGVSLNTIFESGYYLNPSTKGKLSRLLGSLFMIYYNNVENWPALIVINTVSGNAIYIPRSFVKESGNDPFALEVKLNPALNFGLPALTPKASRRIIPSVFCNA